MCLNLGPALVVAFVAARTGRICEQNSGPSKVKALILAFEEGQGTMVVVSCHSSDRRNTTYYEPKEAWKVTPRNSIWIASKSLVDLWNWLKIM